MIHFPKWKILLIVAILIGGLATAAPNFVPVKITDSLPDWVPHQRISLGLDLQGGSHLLLEVEADVVIRERLEASVDAVRQELRKARILYERIGIVGNGIGVTIKNAADVEKARGLLRTVDPDMTLQVVEGGRIQLTLKEEAVRARRSAAIEQSIEIVRRRIDETGVREPTIQRQGEDRILVQLPGLDDPDRIKSLLGKTAKMTFHLLDDRNTVADAQAGRVPPGSRLMPGAEEQTRRGSSPMYLVQKRVMVSGDTLVDSQPSFDQRTNEPIVSFRFDSVGAKRFGDVTSKNVGKPFAIVLDGKVISAPVIREPILGGTGQISGGFTVQAAKDLALLLRAGALPAPLTVLEERTVGPGLGADSIAAGKMACAVALVAVMVFMVAAYGLFGLISNLALIVNMILIVAALSVLQATLTLPGIAGIVLTMGMAVDANVLIYERMREEARAGRTPISAIDAGYSRALTTIIDANLTTLIAALILYFMGSGPIRGFAVTLAVGIATSLFTAVMVSRLIIVGWLRRTRPQELPI